jgi:hypothetical protein
LKYYPGPRLILDYRAERLRQLKLMFPPKGSETESVEARGGAAARAALRRLTVQQAALDAERAVVRAQARSPAGVVRVSADVAPATMFQRDRGLSDTQTAVVVRSK